MTKSILALAKEAYSLEDYAKAETLLLQVCAVHDDLADVNHMLGVIYFRQELFDKAEKHFKQALQKNPHLIKAALNLARVYDRLGRSDEARATFNSLLMVPRQYPPPFTRGELDPYVRDKLANMHAELADVYHGAGMCESAREEYRKALGHRPGFLDIRLRLAQCFADEKEYEAAVTEIEAILATRPTYVSAWVQLGEAFWSMGRKDRAVEAWRQALLHDPDNATCRAYLDFAGAGSR